MRSIPETLKIAAGREVGSMAIAGDNPAPPAAPENHETYFRDNPFMQIVLSGRLEIFHAQDGELCKTELLPGDFFLNLRGGWDQRRLYGGRRLLAISFLNNRYHLSQSYRKKNTPPNCAERISQMVFVPAASPAALLGEAFYACAENRQTRDEARALLRPFLRTLLHASQCNIPTKEGKAEKLWMDIAQYISENLGRDINRQQTARSFSISPDYLGRLCRRQTGSNFVSFLRDQRMKKAQRLLQSAPDISVKRLACECGYCEPSYMIKVFRKYFGHTPKWSAQE